ncbi:MAG: hypothetical protein D6808_05700 [Candidatus Dadabacteria bacterium]|nr:MAG: hypothetical protein D6808_05700 [Candidatus Dadabacteria bacterium]
MHLETLHCKSLRCIQPSHNLEAEKGSIIFGLSLIIIAIMLSSMAINYARIGMALASAQSAADSASLAGSSTLKPRLVVFGTNLPPHPDSLSGWRSSKVAVFEALKRNKIFNTGNEIHDGPSGSTCLKRLYNSPYDVDIDYAECMKYDFPSFTLQIERGLYYSLNGEVKFASLENKEFCDVTPSCMGIATPDVANAIKVTIALKDLSLIFTNFLPGGSISIQNISRTSLATRGIFY